MAGPAHAGQGTAMGQGVQWLHAAATARAVAAVGEGWSWRGAGVAGEGGQSSPPTIWGPVIWGPVWGWGKIKRFVDP